MIRNIALALLALLLAAPAAQAQQASPILGIDTSGSCRNLSVYDATNPATDKMAPIACVNTTTHQVQIPSSRITGLGTAATVNTGTSGTAIPLLSGANSWSGSQTFLTTTNLSPASGAAISFINAPAAGQLAILGFRTGTIERWRIQKNAAAETGSAAGSDLAFVRYDDAGASLGAALTIARSTGAVSIPNAAITGGSITGITDLAVADGGTGASTASAARTNLGLGSLATQDAGSATITGGSITGLSTLSVVHPSAAAISSIDAIAGQSALLSYRTAGSERWRWMKDNTAESGSNAGSSMLLTRYSDAGSFIATAVTVSRANGSWAFGGDVLPDGDNTRALGSAAARWGAAYIYRPVLGARAITGDASFTLTAGSQPYETIHTGTLTANRTITCSTTGAADGDRFKFVGKWSGAFTYSFCGLKTMSTGSWAVVTYVGGAWTLTEYGTL